MHRHAGDDTSAMPTWGAARVDAIDRLRRGAAPATAALDADLLLAFAAGTTKEEVLAHPQRPLSDDLATRFSLFVERRATGEPVAYLRGWKEFYGLRFAVDPRVLIPRPETETLVDEARGLIAGRALTVVDVGTGSGAIACALAAHEPAIRVIATDMSREALAVARTNAASLGVAERIEFREGDLLAPVTERVDLVCANLPYLPEHVLTKLEGDSTSLAFEPRGAVVAGADGLAVIRRAVSGLPRILAPRAAALFECDPPQADPIAMLLKALGLDVRIIRDLTGAERVVSGYLPR